jgi:hypothetical protein
MNRLRAAYHEGKRILRHGPSYPYLKHRGPARILDARPVHTDKTGDVTVCSLTSKYDWRLCLWALVSFYEFSRCTLPLMIYDDGTVPGSAREQILKVFPNASIIDRRSADTVVPNALSAYPNCLRFRNAQPCARRIVDLPVLCGTRRILMLDSDILFLKPPEELVEHLQSREPGQFVFERDMQHAYFASGDEIRDWFGVEVSPRANCGIMLADVSDFKYELLERWLGRGGFERHPWAEQTLWSMYAGRGRTTFWGKEYDVSSSPEIDPGIVLKHYIKPIREFIYTDGIPHIRAKLEARGVFRKTNA